MGKISVLGFEIANLIAAGEVVDRPASVLKELLENALDAGATTVTAEIKNGGVSLIRVTDNGCGMTPEDLPVSIRRHATSKIRSAEDLAAITTLGFRGEALAAIASVSEMRILSKTADAASGTMLTSVNGNVTEICEVGCADGTSVVVENLFGNVPARRKFLKKDVTEASAVAAAVEKIAMSRPEVAIRLIIDGNEKFATSGDGNLQNALYALLGRDFALRLLPLSGGNGGITVSGFVGRSDNARGNRNAQNVFINGRYVRSKTVTAALERAYTSYLAPEKFPVAAIFLECDPTLVDVNVHPAKLEVRFSNEQTVFEAVYYSVRGALESDTSRPEMTLSGHTGGTSYRTDAVPVGGETPAWKPRGPFRAPAPEATATPGASARFLSDYAKIREASVSRVPLRSEGGGFGKLPEPNTPVENPIPAPPSYRLIGSAFETYLLIEQEDGLLLVDQHAAHERILFEELLAQQKKDGRVLSQSLLLPLKVSLTEEELDAASVFRDALESVGFSFTVSDEGHSVELTGIPEAVMIPASEELFTRMCAELAEGRGNPAMTEAARRERALYQVACKAAIKGGRSYDPAHLEWLCARIMRLPDITVCPHGRPIAVRLTKGELDRRFDRIK